MYKFEDCGILVGIQVRCQCRLERLQLLQVAAHGRASARFGYSPARWGLDPRLLLPHLSVAEQVSPCRMLRTFDNDCTMAADSRCGGKHCNA
jgi:hypothetical protein